MRNFGADVRIGAFAGCGFEGVLRSAEQGALVEPYPPAAENPVVSTAGYRRHCAA